jgi:hypothetical protein
MIGPEENISEWRVNSYNDYNYNFLSHLLISIS